MLRVAGMVYGLGNGPRYASPIMCKGLNVTPRLLMNSREMEAYAERVLLVTEDDFVTKSLDPVERNNLLLYVRAEVLPTPAVMWKEACKREPYLRDIPGLRKWVLDHMIGTVTPRDAEEGDGHTARCSGCGSSFMGFPLKDHSFKDCYLVNTIPKEFLLDFAVANSLAFCGGCGSRSTYHQVSDCNKQIKDDPSKKPKTCRCGSTIHKQYHGCCDDRATETPESFRAKVIARRLARGKRIRWLAEQGFLGFQLPTDYLPNAVLDEIHTYMNKGVQLKGAGALVVPLDQELGEIHFSSYRWKPYPGLMTVEGNNHSLHRPVQLTDKEVDWFVVAESRARESYYARRAEGVYSPLLEKVYNIPYPNFPGHIYAPGSRRLNVGVVDEPNRDGNAAMVAPGQEVQQPDQAPIVEERPVALGRIVNPTLSITGVSPAEALPEVIDSIVTKANANRIPSDSSLSDSISTEEAKTSFKDRVGALMEKYEGSLVDTRQIWTLESGEETDDWKYHREQSLRDLVAKETEMCRVNAEGNRFSVKIPRPVVDVLSSLEFPTDRPSKLWRVGTWQILLTGQHDSSDTEFVDSVIDRYGQFLIGLGQSFQGDPCCFISLTSSRFGNLTESWIKCVPTIGLFQDPYVAQEMKAWMSTPLDSLASFNSDPKMYPFKDSHRRKMSGLMTVEEEQDGEKTLESVLNVIDVPRQMFSTRYQIPSEQVIDILMMNDIPCRKDTLVSRIMIIQRTLVGATEARESLRTIRQEPLKEYVIFMNALLEAMRCLARHNKSTSIRISDCVMDLIHSSTNAVDIVVPSVLAFKRESLQWWYTWANVFFVPLLKRVSSVSCSCHLHMRILKPNPAQVMHK